MMMTIANWHGEQAAEFYQKWSRTGNEPDLRNYCRHAYLAKKMWAALSKVKQ